MAPRQPAGARDPQGTPLGGRFGTEGQVLQSQLELQLKALKDEQVARDEALSSLKEVNRLEENITKIQQQREVAQKMTADLLGQTPERLKDALKQMGMLNDAGRVLAANLKEGGAAIVTNFEEAYKILQTADNLLTSTQRKMKENIIETISMRQGMNTPPDTGVADQITQQATQGANGGSSLHNAEIMGGLIAMGRKTGLSNIPGLGSIFETATLMKLAGGLSTGGGLIAGVGAVDLFKQMAGDYQSLTQIGRSTGEGFGAGLSAVWHGLIQGANPFDLVTNSMSQAIQAGVRSEGFRGSIANYLSDSVGEVVNQLGIDWKLALETLSTVTRASTVNLQGANQIFQEFTGTLDSFKNIAHDTWFSTQQLTTAWQEAVTTGAMFGGQPGAEAASAAVTAAAQLQPGAPVGALQWPAAAAGSQMGAAFAALGGATGFGILNPQAHRIAVAKGFLNLFGPMLASASPDELAVLAQNMPGLKEVMHLEGVTNLHDLLQKGALGGAQNLLDHKKALDQLNSAVNQANRGGGTPVTATHLRPSGNIRDIWKGTTQDQTYGRYDEHWTQTALKNLGIMKNDPRYKFMHTLLGIESETHGGKEAENFVSELQKVLSQPGSQNMSPDQILRAMHPTGELAQIIKQNQQGAKVEVEVILKGEASKLLNVKTRTQQANSAAGNNGAGNPVHTPPYGNRKP